MSERVVTTACILEALRAEYPREKGWVTAEEVQGPDGRRADLVAWNTWDGRVHVVEVKMSRGDWNLERSTPGKAGAFASECDAFWLATTSDVVRAGEIPEPWGLFLVDPNGVSKAPGRRLGGHPSHELATAFIRRLSADDTLRDLLAGERAAGVARGKKEALAETRGVVFSREDVENAFRRGERAERRRWHSKQRKQEGALG